MKRFILPVCVLFLVISCTSFPQPESVHDSLIIGRLQLEFPDGFFDQSPRTVKNGVKVNIYNATTQFDFSVSTNNGFFYFVSNGSDKYVLTSYEYHTKAGSGTYNINPNRIEKRLPTASGEVIYVGDLTFRYSAPALSKQYGGGSQRTYDYKILDKKSWDKNAVAEYLEKKQPKGEWLGYEIVEYKSWIHS